MIIPYYCEDYPEPAPEPIKPPIKRPLQSLEKNETTSVDSPDASPNDAQNVRSNKEFSREK